MVAYADDCQIIVTAKTLIQLKKKIEKVIAKAQQWYEANSMKNNTGKTEVLVLNPGRKMKTMFKVKVIDDDKPIEIETKPTIKVLGVHLDQQLDWKKQVNGIKKKAMNSIRKLNRVNSILPLKYRIQLYKTLVEPHFSYADVVWGGCGITNAKSLQIAQNFAARSMLGMKKTDSATAALNKLHLLNLKQRRMVHETVFVHKSLLNKHPEDINLSYQQHLPRGNTRHAAAEKFNIPTHHTAKYEHSPIYRTIAAWNRVPSSIPTGDIKKHKIEYQKLLRNLTKA